MTPAIFSRILVLVLAAAIAALVHLGGLGPFQAAERFAHDFRIRFSPRVESERRVVIVDIDEASLAALGPWPWPRSRMASLVEVLARDYHAALVGLDIIFPDSRPDDPRLRDAFAGSPVVLAQVFDPLLGSQNRSGRLADPLPGIAHRLHPGVAEGFLANHAGLLFDGVSAGHITPTLDEDGRVRRLQAVWCYVEHCSVPLALRMYMSLSGTQGIDLVRGAWGGETLHLSPDIGPALPLDKTGAVLLPYRLAPTSLLYIPAADVLSQRVPRKVLNNALVLIGSTALGLGDRVATPLSPLTPGVAVHAELLTALLDDALVKEFPQAHWVLFAVELAWGLVLLSIIGRDRRPWLLVLWTLSGMVAWGLANLFLWRDVRVALPVSPIWVFLMVSFVFLAPLENRRAWLQLGGLVQQVSSYIPATVVQRLLGGNSAVGPALDAEQQLVTVLYADVRGFTTLAEKEAPERVALLVQHLLSELSAVVVAHGGTVEKFTGDGLMAIWGAPDPDANHAANALGAAVGLQQCVAAMQPWLAERDFPALRLGVGINTGEAVVGIYGNASHRAFTAHGDAINVGERIQRLTRELGIPILFGEATARLIPDDTRRYVGSYAVPGRVQQVAVWCLPGDAPLVRGNAARRCRAPAA